MKGKGVPLIVFCVLISNEALDSLGQYCFKKTAQAQGDMPIRGLADAFAFVSGTLCEGYLWLGLGAASLVFISWTAILSKINLSVASPITSISYVFVALTSLVFLHEHISATRWLGILLILGGVAIVSLGSNRDQDRKT